MKKILLPVAVICTFVSYAFSQQLIPNAGFENWVHYPAAGSCPAYDEPVSWSSYNALCANGQGHPVTVFQSTDTCAGQFSVEIRNVGYINLVDGNPYVQQGTLETGSNLIANIVGLQYTYVIRPVSMSVCVKYQGVGTNVAEIGVQFYKHNNVTNHQDNICCNQGTCLYHITASSASHYMITVPFSNWLTPTIVPDTFLIFFSPSSVPGSVDSGSVLWVDGPLIFNYNVGTNIISDNDNSVFVYPNPAVNEINISSLPVGLKTIRLIDITGKEIIIQKAAGGSAKLDVGMLNRGLYIFEIANGAGKIISKGKISLQE